MKIIYFLIFTICCNVHITTAWDAEQLEVLDIIEEVKENLYSVLNISQDATNQEIKSAFRGLSLKLHPDKNPNVDTSIQFRHLVSAYEVLRSNTKRKYYDEFLVKGLPNWRSSIYYYRYVRKMGMSEACIILLLIVTIGQYLISWAAYLERKYTIVSCDLYRMLFLNVEQNKKTKRKKDRDRDKVDELESLIKPSVLDTLPIQIPRLLWYITLNIIPWSLQFYQFVFPERIEPIEEPEMIELPKEKTVRKRNRGFQLPEGPNFENPTIPQLTTTTNTQQTTVRSGGLWTDDDLDELTRLVKKYPSGTLGRWELIADSMERSVEEVTYMANKIKENLSKFENDKHEDEQQQPIKIKQKTKKSMEINEDDDNNDVKNWTQIQQKALEEALVKYPKGCTDRWDRIADHIPGKNKEECMLRFRYLATILKKQKSPTGDV